MNIRDVARVLEREGVGTTSRLGMQYLRVLSVDRLKSSLGHPLGVEFWASYNRRCTELSFHPRSVADPFEKRWVDPTTIQRKPRFGCFDKLTTLGSVRGGPWDESVSLVADHPTVRGLRQRFEEGRAWEDTIYVAVNVAAIETGETRMGCSSLEEFLDVRCAYLDRLFERISTDGYRTQEELDGAMIDTNRFEVNRNRLLTNEIGVNIGHDGSFLVNSGFHRLAISRILGLELIPVQVIVRHRQWQRTRMGALNAAPESLPAELHAHPDLVGDLMTASNRVAV